MNVFGTSAKILLGILGVTICAVSFSPLWTHVLHQKTATRLSAYIAYDKLQAQGGIENLWERVEATLSFQVEHPKTVDFGDSFLVTTTVSITDPKAYLISKGINSWEKLLPMQPDELADRASVLFSSGIAGVNLALSGATISPAGTQPVAEDHQVVWSVTPDNPGQLKGYVYGTWLEEASDSSDVWKGAFDENVFFTIKVNTNVLTFDNIMTWIGHFCSPLLTLPGIIAFFRARREKKLEVAARSKIIIPGRD